MKKKQEALQSQLKEEHEQMQRKYQQFQVPQPPTFQGAAFQQLQPSRTVELTQQGRVLIRSRLDPPPPKFVLNEIPFKTPIQEALNIMGIFRPKLIQAHVWETILPGYNVAFVAGNRSGKTLGSFSFFILWSRFNSKFCVFLQDTWCPFWIIFWTKRTTIIYPKASPHWSSSFALRGKMLKWSTNTAVKWWDEFR